jgi:hypothetical protein
MGLRRAPYAFTQEGIAMLSSVLRSERAIQMNIVIMRAFVRRKLERGQGRAASAIEVLVEDIDRLGRAREYGDYPWPPATNR